MSGITETGLSEWISYFDSLTRGIDARALDAVLQRVFDDTQSRVHVLSGALKASGHRKSQHDATSWTGEITYGDEASVIYAWYEQRRGGTHDFLANVPQYDEWILHAMDTALKT